MKSILESIEFELSKALRLEYIKKNQYEFQIRPTAEEAKSILMEGGYLTSDEWIWKPVYMWLRSKLDYESIIDQMMTQDTFYKTVADVISKSYPPK